MSTDIRKAKDGRPIGRRALNRGNKDGRTPLPPGKRKVPMQLYVVGEMVEALGGKDPVRAIALAAIELAHQRHLESEAGA
jgi:hypothetical protein